MNAMKLKPMLTYRLRGTMRSIAGFVAVMIGVYLFINVSVLLLSAGGNNSSFSFSAFSFAASVALFVMGITSVREDLRLALQNGVGRRTAFLAQVLSVMAAALTLAVAGELLLRLQQALTAQRPEFTVTDLFYMIFTHGESQGLPFGVYLQSVLFTFLLGTCASLAGAFISLVFYRLNKFWTLVVAIGGPLLLSFGPSVLMYKFGNWIAPIFRYFFSTPWTVSLFFSLGAVLFGVLVYLLLRRAPVKPAK